MDVLVGDGLSTVMELLPVVDIAHMRATCSTGSHNPFGEKSVHLGRLADKLLDGIKKTHHDCRKGSSRSSGSGSASSSGSDSETQEEEQEDLPTVVVDEQMDASKFELLFGRRAGIVKKPDNSVEMILKKPAEVIQVFPGLPPAVFDVNSNAPTMPLCPLRCWAGYADGRVRYDPYRSRLELRVRSRVLKLCGYWEKTLDSALLQSYLEA
jgi:hypothetical protein